MLSDAQIKHAIRWRHLAIRPYDPARMQPASYDVRLHPTLLLLRTGGPLDPKVDTSHEWVRIVMGDDGYTLMPDEFLLGSTLETFEIPPTLLGQLEGKSSLGRLGLQVHSTAGYLDPGFQGQVTLELSCVQDRGLRLYPGMPIGQVAFDDVTAVLEPYSGKYLGQEGPTPSRYHLNWTPDGWK